MSEVDLQKEIIYWLEVAGYQPFRMPLGAVKHGGVRKRHPLKGFPDLFTFSKHGTGRLITIECKTAKGKLSPEQEKWCVKLIQAGVLYVIGRDAGTVIEELATKDVSEIIPR